MRQYGNVKNRFVSSVFIRCTHDSENVTCRLWLVEGLKNYIAVNFKGAHKHTLTNSCC